MKKLSIITSALLLSVNISAQTFNVSTIEEMQSALENSAVNGEHDTIIIEDGTYYIYNGLSFVDSEDKNLTIKAKNPPLLIEDDIKTNVIFRSSYSSSYSLLNINNENMNTSKVTIEGISFEDSNSRAIWSSAPLNILKSKFNDNSVKETYVGIVCVTNNIEVYNSKFYNNSSGGGGAIYSTGFTIIDKSEFTYNRAKNKVKSGSNQKGGAIFTEGDLIVTNSYFSYNEAFREGGAIYSDSSNTYIFNSTFKNNEASDGGAIYGQGYIQNNLFQNNIANEISTSNYSYIYNNAIDIDYLNGNLNIKKNNISSSSSLSDKGNNEINVNNTKYENILTELLKKDYNNNLRDDTYDIGHKVISDTTTSNYSYNIGFIGKDYKLQLCNTDTNDVANVKIYVEECCDDLELVYQGVWDDNPISINKDYKDYGFNTYIELVLNNGEILNLKSNYTYSSSLDEAKAYFSKLDKGWYLSSSPSYSYTNELFDYVSLVWTYKDSNWYAYSPIEDKQKSINLANIKTIENIEENQGFWVYKNGLEDKEFRTLKYCGEENYIQNSDDTAVIPTVPIY